MMLKYFFVHLQIIELDVFSGQQYELKHLRQSKMYSWLDKAITADDTVSWWLMINYNPSEYKVWAAMKIITAYQWSRRTAEVLYQRFI